MGRREIVMPFCLISIVLFIAICIMIKKKKKIEFTLFFAGISLLIMGLIACIMMLLFICAEPPVPTLILMLV